MSRLILKRETIHYHEVKEASGTKPSTDVWVVHMGNAAAETGLFWKSKDKELAKFYLCKQRDPRTADDNKCGGLTFGEMCKALYGFGEEVGFKPINIKDL